MNIAKISSAVHLLLIAAVLCLFVIAAVSAAPLMELLLPGDSQDMRIASETLVESVESGTPLVEALSVFCKEIVTSAQIEGLQ